MTAIAEDREWGVKSIKQRWNGEYGNIEIGNDRTVPINERRARVDGVLISLVTEGMDDCPHLYPEAQDKEIEQRAPRRVHCSGCCNHD